MLKRGPVTTLKKTYRSQQSFIPQNIVLYKPQRTALSGHYNQFEHVVSSSWRVVALRHIPVLRHYSWILSIFASVHPSASPGSRQWSVTGQWAAANLNMNAHLPILRSGWLRRQYRGLHHLGMDSGQQPVLQFFDNPFYQGTCQTQKETSLCKYLPLMSCSFFNRMFSDQPDHIHKLKRFLTTKLWYGVNLRLGGWKSEWWDELTLNLRNFE